MIHATVSTTTTCALATWAGVCGLMGVGTAPLDVMVPVGWHVGHLLTSQWWGCASSFSEETVA